MRFWAEVHDDKPGDIEGTLMAQIGHITTITRPYAVEAQLFQSLHAGLVPWRRAYVIQGDQVAAIFWRDEQTPRGALVANNGFDTIDDFDFRCPSSTRVITLLQAQQPCTASYQEWVLPYFNEPDTASVVVVRRHMVVQAWERSATNPSSIELVAYRS